MRRGPEVAAFSGGTAGSPDMLGATVTFRFTGTAVSWIGLGCSAGGIATVSIDGGAATRIEDTDPAVSYTGTWIHGTDVRATGGTFAEANLTGAVATLSFSTAGPIQ